MTTTSSLLRDTRRRRKAKGEDASESSAVCPASNETTHTLKHWQRILLRSLLVSPDVTVACSKAGISRQTAYRVRQQDPAFAEAWQAALDKSIDALEAKGFSMAKAGDASLIQWLLRCHRPERYRETSRTEIGIAAKIVLIPAKVAGDE